MPDRGDGRGGTPGSGPFDSVSNTSRLRWSYPQGAEVPRLPELRSLLISAADPYHLQDLPSIGTAINGYTPSAQTVQAILAAIAGAAPFLGASPVDQFGGYPDARR